MRLRHPLIFALLLALLIAVDPIEWIWYWIEITRWNIQNPTGNSPH